MCISQLLFAQKLSLIVDGLKKEKGNVKIAVFESQSGFPSEHNKAIYSKVLPSKGNKLSLNVAGLKPGTYAVAVLHDANDNGEMDFNFLGMPKEGFGFSNNPTSLKKPDFRDSQFSFDDKGKTVYINLRYL